MDSVEEEEEQWRSRLKSSNCSLCGCRSKIESEETQREILGKHYFLMQKPINQTFKPKPLNRQAAKPLNREAKKPNRTEPNRTE